MSLAIPSENVTQAPRELHMEMFNAQTGDVWLNQSPVTMDEYKAFKPAPPFMKSGIGRSSFDTAHFRRSPGAAEDGPLETCEVGGMRWARVAKPKNFRGMRGGDAPTLITVEKHHVLGYAAGTRLHLVRLPDGSWYLEQTVSADGSVVAPPAEWAMHSIELAQPWQMDFGCPVQVFFFRNLRSFIGPLREDQLPQAPVAA